MRSSRAKRRMRTQRLWQLIKRYALSVVVIMCDDSVCVCV